MKIPFIKNIENIPLEPAHDGSGSRQVLLSQKNNISSQIEAMTKWFLKPWFCYDWHNHIAIDEIWIVLQWSWYIEYEDGTKFQYKKDDIIYNPSNLKHKIVAEWKEESVYYFIRVKS